jgi:RNA polymerase sigma factor for flagellar operon FliA
MTGAAVADSPEILARFHGQLDLVGIVAKQMSRRVGHAVTLDDLQSFGHEGLLHAARSFDPDHGVPFRRWANLRIKGAIIDGLRQLGNLPRRLYRELASIEAADRVLAVYDEEDAARPATTPDSANDRLSEYLSGLATALSLGSVISPESLPSDDASPEEQFATAEFQARVRAVVAALPERERALIERYYFEGQTLDEAAASIGLSKSWGSRLHARAIEAILKELRRSGDT